MWESRSPIYQKNETKNVIRSNERDFQKFSDSKHLNLSLSEETYASALENTLDEKTILAEVNKMFSLEVCVKEGNFIMFTNTQDPEQKAQPNPKGKLQFNLKEMRLFSVTGFNNDKNLDYFCAQINETELLHCGEFFLDYQKNLVSTNNLFILWYFFLL